MRTKGNYRIKEHPLCLRLALISSTLWGFCLGWRLASSGVEVFQVGQTFFEFAGDKLRIFRVGDNVRGDKYHQFRLFKGGGLGTKQFSYIGEVFQYRNA